MFGYIRPFKPEMLVKEYDVYKSIYCGLCKNLGRNFGVLSRLTLSYDCTFLTMIALSLKEECPGFTAGRCVVNPLKKCGFCSGGEEEYSLTGAISVILTYYKIKDDIQDSGFWGKLRARCLLVLSAGAYRKAKRKHPAADDIVSQCMQRQAQIEADSAVGIDSAAEPTAQMLSELLMLFSKDSERILILSQLGYFIGRWIYLIDAADDIDKDIGHGNFNPFVKKLITEKEPPMEKAELHQYCNSVLNQTLSQAISAFNLLKVYHFGAILKNTITLGLPAMQKQILFDEEKKHVRSI